VGSGTGKNAQGGSKTGGSWPQLRGQGLLSRASRKSKIQPTPLEREAEEVEAGFGFESVAWRLDKRTNLVLPICTRPPRERYVEIVGVTGSIPVPPTIQTRRNPPFSLVARTIEVGVSWFI
jgi:hypothetical protein